MRKRWVPPYYQRDLLQKLQHLKQGKNSVEEYYQELQTGLIRCGVIEDIEPMLACFRGGLNKEIHTILEYKEYHTITRLFHLACIAEREVQDRQASRPNFLQVGLLHGLLVHVLHTPPHHLLAPLLWLGKKRQTRHQHHFLLGLALLVPRNRHLL